MDRTKTPVLPVILDLDWRSPPEDAAVPGAGAVCSAVLWMYQTARG